MGRGVSKGVDKVIFRAECFEKKFDVTVGDEMIGVNRGGDKVMIRTELFEKKFEMK